MSTRRFIALALVSAVVTAIASAQEAGVVRNNILDAVERKIGKEPKYASAPRYGLMVFGAKAQTKVWMVEDGETLYVDKNANGDLTDDGPPLVLRGGDYILDRITAPDGTHHTSFQLRRWSPQEPHSGYGLSVTVNGRTPMYAGWFGTFWSALPTEVPVIHFGGSLQPRMLINKEFIVGDKNPNPDPRRLAIALFTPGLGDGAQALLSIAALPATAVPVVHIDWPVAPGAAPLRTSHRLTERCCYWCFYDTTFKVPAAAVAGAATVRVSLPLAAWPLHLATDQVQVPVRVAGATATAAQ